MNRTKVAGSLRGHTSKPGGELCSLRGSVDPHGCSASTYCITNESVADAASPPVVATLREQDMEARYMVGPYDEPWQLTGFDSKLARGATKGAKAGTARTLKSSKVLGDNHEQVTVNSSMASVLLVSEYDWSAHIDRTVIGLRASGHLSTWPLNLRTAGSRGELVPNVCEDAFRYQRPT